MKIEKIGLILLLTLVAATISFGQGSLGKGGKQLNAGLGFSSFGVPIYAGLDFGVHQDVTIGPRIDFRTYNQRFGSIRSIRI